MVWPPTRWFVGFCDQDIPAPWKWFTRPGFVHVWATTYIDVWLFLEWSSYRLFIELVDGDTVDALFAISKKSGTLIETRSVEEPVKLTRPTMPTYCVSLLKQLLGLRGVIVTPYQLFCAIKRDGGRVIFQQKET